MRQIDQAGLEKYVREQWAKNGLEVSSEGEAPYKEFARVEGFSFGLRVQKGGVKARVGVWCLPPGKSINDLAGLRTHYQGTLQKQNRHVRISNCGTEVGTIFLFWDSTQPLEPQLSAPWNAMVEDCAACLFDGDALDEFLESYR